MAWFFYMVGMSRLMNRKESGRWTDCVHYTPPKGILKAMACEKEYNFCYSMSCDDYQSSCQKVSEK